jgi:hypothetical protein
VKSGIAGISRSGIYSVTGMQLDSPAVARTARSCASCPHSPENENLNTHQDIVAIRYGRSVGFGCEGRSHRIVPRYIKIISARN